MKRLKSIYPIAAALLSAFPAAAQDQKIIENSALSDAAVASPDFLFLGGGSVELDFYGNSSDSNTGFTAESYLELENHGFYAGVWGSASNESADNEVDAYLGYRKKLDSGFKYDLGYRRYFFPNDGNDCCGQLTLGFSMPVGDKLSLGVSAGYDPESNLSTGTVSAEYDISDTWAVSANYGTYVQSDATSDTEWDFGGTYALNDKVGLDVRYNDGDEEDPNLGVSVVFDTTFLSH